MQQSFHAHAKVFFSWNGKVRETKALVSEMGIQRLVQTPNIFSRNDYQSILRNSAFFALEFHPIPFQGKFQRELSADGSHLNVQFQNLSESQKRALRDHIFQNAQEQGWKRKSPRVKPNEFMNNTIEFPVCAFIKSPEITKRLKLIDFNAEGFLFENKLVGNTSDFIPKDLIRISIYTNLGREIKDLLAKVVRTSEFTIRSPIDSPKTLQLLGLELVKNVSHGEREYGLLLEKLVEKSPMLFEGFPKETA